MVESRNIGIKVKMPEKDCNDKKCPFHGQVSLRGREFTGIVIARDVHRTATVEWIRTVKIPKYERYATKRTKIRVHNSPCIDAKEGDNVRVMECKPLSKTKNFVVIENLGKQFGFEQIEEARIAAKHDYGKKVEEKEENKDESSER